MAPGRWSSAYSLAGRTSTSCAPCATSRRTPSRSIWLGMATSVSSDPTYPYPQTARVLARTVRLLTLLGVGREAWGRPLDATAMRGGIAHGGATVAAKGAFLGLAGTESRGGLGGGGERGVWGK